MKYYAMFWLAVTLIGVVAGLFSHPESWSLALGGAAAMWWGWCLREERRR